MSTDPLKTSPVMKKLARISWISLDGLTGFQLCENCSGSTTSEVPWLRPETWKPPRMRDICMSRTYQASLTPNATNLLDTRQFSHAHLRRLRADVLLDSLMLVSGGKYGLAFFPENAKAIEYYPLSDGDTLGSFTGDPFFQTFGRSGRSSVCTCETKREATLSQTLHLMVGNTVGEKIETGLVVKQILEQHKTADEVINALFIRALCRRPTDQEMQQIRSQVSALPAEEIRLLYEDVLWSLMNSTEFSSNH